MASNAAPEGAAAAAAPSVSSSSTAPDAAAFSEPPPAHPHHPARGGAPQQVSLLPSSTFIFPPAAKISPGDSLDRSAFSCSFQLLALRIKPTECKEMMDRLRKVLLNMPRLRNIVQDPANPEAEAKLLLLSPAIRAVSELPAPLHALVAHCEPVPYTLSLDYSYWSSEQILHAALPDTLAEVTSSFEAVGHIAHMNLRDEQLPYKKFIGEVILDKNKHIRTVVNKLSSIDTTFRFFHMELLAGEDNYVTRLKESGCMFELDFSKVYWNSRLQGEHNRIVKLLTEDDVVCDMFAGIGPFAVPAAARGVRVLANDLNPASHKYLVQNALLNSVTVHAFNMDARDFVRTAAELADKNPSMAITRVLMNLPGSAIEFLDVFRGLYAPPHRRSRVLPILHCYAFSKAADPSADVVARAAAVLGHALTVYTVFDVRDVAPSKRMMCLTFPLPSAVAYEEGVGPGGGAEARSMEGGASSGSGGGGSGVANGVGVDGDDAGAAESGTGGNDGGAAAAAGAGGSPPAGPHSKRSRVEGEQ